MEYHLTSLAMNFRCEILDKKYLLVTENLAVITLPLCDNVTTKHFLDKMLYFKAYKKLELPLYIVFSTWSTIRLV